MAQLWMFVESFAIVFGIKFVDQTLQTLFMNYMVKGNRFYTFVFGFLEVCTFLLALSQVLTNMTIYKMLGYAFGYSSGAIFGMWLEQKLAIGNQTWLIIPNDDPYRLAYYLRDRGFGITTIAGSGMDKTRTIILTTVMRKNIPLLNVTLQELAPDAFVSVLDTRTTMGGHVHRIARG
ncbi:MAG: DUF5698 domain-containing protein [Candidatus Cryosericum sp.]|nr:DUF5698 domain-containing protein [bacterium]